MKKCLHCRKLLRKKPKRKRKYCSIKCKSQYCALRYYYKNRKIVLLKQIKYKSQRYLKDKKFRKLDNFRKYSCHNISLKNKKCEICGNKKDLQRHHKNYKNPLDIIILCRKHHNEIHKTRRGE